MYLACALLFAQSDGCELYEAAFILGVETGVRLDAVYQYDAICGLPCGFVNVGPICSVVDLDLAGCLNRMLLDSMSEEDDEYDKLNDWTRENNWILPLVGGAAH